jgi:hypothetical protein
MLAGVAFVRSMRVLFGWVGVWAGAGEQFGRSACGSTPAFGRLVKALVWGAYPRASP